MRIHIMGDLLDPDQRYAIMYADPNLSFLGGLTVKKWLVPHRSPNLIFNKKLTVIAPNFDTIFTQNIFSLFIFFRYR